MSLQKGFVAESLARNYLTQQGLVWIESNYRCRMGEIDLIMRHQGVLVFVEVRSRRSSQFGGALASVTSSKRQKLVKTASYYLIHNRGFESEAARFDVICLDGEPPKITWVTNAFSSEGTL